MAGIKTLSVNIIVIFCCVPYLLSKEGVSYRLNRTLCNKFNPKFINSTYCRVRHINRTTQMLNLEYNIQPNVSLTNIRVDVSTYMKFGTVYRPSVVIKYSEFVCDSLNNGTSSHVLHFLGEMYAKYSNLLGPCPKSGKLYMKNMLIDSSHYPQFVPIGEYRIDVNTFTFMNGKEEFIELTQEYYEVKPLGILRF